LKLVKQDDGNMDPKIFSSMVNEKMKEKNDCFVEVELMDD